MFRPAKLPEGNTLQLVQLPARPAVSWRGSKFHELSLRPEWASGDAAVFESFLLLYGTPPYVRRTTVAVYFIPLRQGLSQNKKLIYFRQAGCPVSSWNLPISTT